MPISLNVLRSFRSRATAHSSTTARTEHVVKILFATTEAVPFCKTGGLGDVCGSLPVELAKLGHEPVIVMPAFRQALNSGRAIRADRHAIRNPDRPQNGARDVPSKHLAGR